MSNNNQLINDPDLAFLAQQIINATLLQLNSHAIGTVQSFDTAKQTAKVNLVYKKIVNGSPVTYAPLVDCPVIFSQGGGGRLTFPIEPGDTCFVFFNDVNMSKFVASGSLGAVPLDTRSHAFSDALIFVGLNSIPMALEDFFTDGVELAFSGTKIQLDDKVKIMNDATDLKAVINGLIDILAATTAGGFPLSSAAALTAYKTTVGSLLK